MTNTVNRRFDAAGRRVDEHRPEAFNPSDYEVADVVDNQPPPPPLFLMFASDAERNRAWELHRVEVERHRAEMRRLFPDGQNVHVCVHCGHNPLRWVAVVKHRPSGKNLVFGAICANRAELPNREAFDVEYLQTAAARRARSYRELQELRARQDAFAADNPELVQAVRSYLASTERNPFVDDVLHRFDQWGTMSDRQVAAVIRAINRLAERRAETDVAGPAPRGREQVTGEVVNTRTQESVYGTTFKMLVKLDNGSKVWSTIPESLWVGLESDDRNLRGKRITFKATFEAGRDNDPTFAIGKRPTNAEVIA